MLDVGCFNGALQRYLVMPGHSCGIEPSQEAAQVAQSRGVTVLGPTIESLDADVEPFDVVIAIDVVEHLPQPLAFFEHAARVLAPEGIAVYGTGDTDASSWRMLGPRYWYCSLPEHVSFYNTRSMQYIARICGLESVEHVQISHVRARPDKRLRQAVRNGVFAAAVRTGGFGIPPLRSKVDRMTPPGWLTAKDHMLHVMRAAPG